MFNDSNAPNRTGKIACCPINWPPPQNCYRHSTYDGTSYYPPDMLILNCKKNLVWIMMSSMLSLFSLHVLDKLNIEVLYFWLFTWLAILKWFFIWCFKNTRIMYVHIFKFQSLSNQVIGNILQDCFQVILGRSILKRVIYTIYKIFCTEELVDFYGLFHVWVISCVPW